MIKAIWTPGDLGRDLWLTDGCTSDKNWENFSKLKYKLQIKIGNKQQRDDSAVKDAYCSHKKPEIASQQPHGASSQKL